MEARTKTEVYNELKARCAKGLSDKGLKELYSRHGIGGLSHVIEGLKYPPHALYDGYCGYLDASWWNTITEGERNILTDIFNFYYETN